LLAIILPDPNAVGPVFSHPSQGLLLHLAQTNLSA